MKSLLRNVMLLAILPVVLLMVSCDTKQIFEKNKSIPHGEWHQNEIVKFNVNIEDSTLPCNMYINVRNSTDYKYSNIFFFLTTLFPDGSTHIDTVECLLADPSGKWFGKGNGSIKSNRLLFRRNIIFTKSGNYSFEFEQAMREEVLKGIEDVGIRIEKANLKNE